MSGGQDDEDAAYCKVVVRKAGETPTPCGLETPCPVHTEDAIAEAVAVAIAEETL